MKDCKESKDPQRIYYLEVYSKSCLSLNFKIKVLYKASKLVYLYTLATNSQAKTISPVCLHKQEQLHLLVLPPMKNKNHYDIIWDITLKCQKPLQWKTTNS